MQRSPKNPRRRPAVPSPVVHRRHLSPPQISRPIRTEPHRRLRLPRHPESQSVTEPPHRRRPVAPVYPEPRRHPAGVFLSRLHKSGQHFERTPNVFVLYAAAASVLPTFPICRTHRFATHNMHSTIDLATSPVCPGHSPRPQVLLNDILVRPARTTHLVSHSCKKGEGWVGPTCATKPGAMISLDLVGAQHCCAPCPQDRSV